MKIQYASDLHLEFKTPQKELDEYFKGGELLILAGDILNGKLTGLDSLKLIAERYDEVLMVMGNHEHYHGLFNDTYSRLLEVLPLNITLLEDEVININGKRFLGCTLWSHMNELEGYFATLSMNDYKIVKYKGIDYYSKLQPKHTVDKWLESRAFLKSNIKEGDIVITHHAPTFESCSEEYNPDSQSSYASNLSELILNTKPSYWIHGHIHKTNNYTVGNTNVLSNPYGYYDYSTNQEFSTKFIEV